MKTKNHLIYGVGINDADYPVTKYGVVDGKRKQVWECPFYRVWRDMIKRCYSELKHKSRPTYIGCSVDSRWHKFSQFKNWMADKDWFGKELDKDIISPGNKIYSPDKCVFVSNALNKFLLASNASRGDFPIGVSWHKRIGKFSATCQNPFTSKKEHLGYFDDSSHAHEAWRKRKHQHALCYAEMQSDQRIAKALALRWAA